MKELAITWVGSVLGALVLKALWCWFVAPVFGLPELSVPGSMGLMLIVSFLSRSLPYEVDDGPCEKVVRAGLWIVVTLVVGWIISWFM